LVAELLQGWTEKQKSSELHQQADTIREPACRQRRDEPIGRGFRSAKSNQQCKVQTAELHMQRLELLVPAHLIFSPRVGLWGESP